MRWPLFNKHFANFTSSDYMNVEQQKRKEPDGGFDSLEDLKGLLEELDVSMTKKAVLIKMSLYS